MQKLTQAHQDKNLKAYVVFMGGPELKDSLEKLASEKGITIPMTFLPQGTSAGDIQAFKVNPQANNTVLVYSRKKVTGNFVNVDPKSFSQVEAATLQVLGK
jgi:hypothetical protein